MYCVYEWDERHGLVTVTAADGAGLRWSPGDDLAGVAAGCRAGRSGGPARSAGVPAAGSVGS